MITHTSLQQSTPQTTGLRTQEKRSLGLFVLGFILMVSSIAALGYASYRAYDQQYRSQVEGQLLAIASLKLDELQGWRNERLGDANLFYRNDDFSELVRRYLEDPADTDAKNTLASWLELIQVHPEYDRVFLLDAQGRERLSVPATPEPTSAYAAELGIVALASSGQITMLDFHRDTPTDVIHLAILIPIFDASEENRLLGVLVLRVDPYVFLYPFIQRWPAPSDSAETLLVRLDGDHVLFLNELRFQPNTALTLRFSLEQTESLAVKAALGQEGVAQGQDYRGVESIGVLRAVPDSPWFLVARMDTAEAFHPLWERLRQTVIFFGALIAGAGMGLMLVWRQQRLHYLRAQAKAQEALTATETELHALFASMTDVVIVYDADGRYVKIASTNSAGLYRPADNMLGQTVHEILPKEQADYIVAKIRTALQSGEVVHSEYSLQIGGKEIWFASNASRLSENTVMWVAHDITERKQAEEKLEDERILLRTLIDNLPDRIYVKDTQGRKIISNIADWQASGGKTMEDIIGKTDYDTYPPELAAGYWALDKTVIDSGMLVINREEPGLDCQGNPVQILTSKMPLRDGQGKVVGLVGIGRDITEQKQAEEEIRQLNTHLEQRVEARTSELRDALEQLARQEKLAVLGQMAGSVAHELRNPLSIITSAIYLLKIIQKDADGETKEYLDFIEKETIISNQIIADLLGFASNSSAESESVSVSDFVRQTLERYPPPTAVEVTIDIPPDLPLVYIDTRQMTQVLGNLTDNACQAMPEGGKLVIHGQLAGSCDQRFVAVSVCDTGVGIQPENMAKLFEPLFTTKPKGIGLGLVVCKKLTEANNGRIEVQSGPGQGSTFTLFLPVKP